MGFRLTEIYTRQGDAGDTGLADGSPRTIRASRPSARSMNSTVPWACCSPSWRTMPAWPR